MDAPVGRRVNERMKRAIFESRSIKRASGGAVLRLCFGWVAAWASGSGEQCVGWGRSRSRGPLSGNCQF